MILMLNIFWQYTRMTADSWKRRFNTFMVLMILLALRQFVFPIKLLLSSRYRALNYGAVNAEQFFHGFWHIAIFMYILSV